MNNKPFQTASNKKQKASCRGGARGALALRMEKEEKKQDGLSKAYSIEYRTQEKKIWNHSRM